MEEKYQKFRRIVSKMDDSIAEIEYDIIVVLFKEFLLNKENIINYKEQWFEKEEIRKDKEYYQAIISTIDAFLNNCNDLNSFKDKLLSKEINKIFNSSKFCALYNIMVRMSFILGLGEENYIQIYCGLLCLGIKKESPIHETLIETIKDFLMEEKFSKNAHQINKINFNKIDKLFFENLSIILNLIILNKDEEKIEEQINILEKKDIKEYRESSLSTIFFKLFLY